MKVLTVLLVSVMMFTAPAVADEDDSIDININLDLNLFSGDEEDENNGEENNTYGERVGGQSVHTEETSADAEVGRDSQEFQITEDTSKEEKGFFSKLFSGVTALFR